MSDGTMRDSYFLRSARVLGLTLDEYLRHHSAGEKWCSKCRAWHPQSDFSTDPKRWDGLNYACRASLRVKVKRYSRHKPMLGKKMTPATRARMSAAHSGEKNARWKGGITAKTRRDRQSAIYQQWRRAVFKRDRYACVKCECVPVTPHAHHIKPIKTHPELRLKVWNGETLCSPCHREVHAQEKLNG